MFNLTNTKLVYKIIHSCEVISSQTNEKNHCIAGTKELFFEAVLRKKKQLIGLFYIPFWYNIRFCFWLFMLSSFTHAQSLQQIRWKEMGPDNLGGRARALLIDQRDTTGNTLFAAFAGCGVFKSYNRGKKWVSLNFPFPSDNPSGLAQAADGTIYISTGEYKCQHSRFESCLNGNGIYVLDSLNEFHHLDSTSVQNPSSSPWSSIAKLVTHKSDPKIFWAATHNGIYKTINGGFTWRKMLQINTQEQLITSNFVFSDIEISPDGDYIYAGTANGNLFIAFANSDTLKLKTPTNVTFPNFNRLEIAVNKNYPNTVYAFKGENYNIIKSDDFGQNWYNVSFNIDNSNLANFCEGQCWWTEVMAIKPDDTSTVYVGGKYLTRVVLEDSIRVCHDINANVGNDHYLFNNMYAITLDDRHPNRMYVCTDGGIYYSESFDNSSGYHFFKNLSQGIKASLTQSVGASNDGKMTAGSIDHGLYSIENDGSLDGNILNLDWSIGSDYFSFSDSSLFSASWGKITRTTPSGMTRIEDSILNPSEFEFNTYQFSKSSLWLQHAETKSAFNCKETYVYYGNEENSDINFIADKNYEIGDSILLQSKIPGQYFYYHFSSPILLNQQIQLSDPIRARLFIFVKNPSTNQFLFFICPKPFDENPLWYQINIDSLGNTITIPNLKALTVSHDGNTVYAISNHQVHKFTGFNYAKYVWERNSQNNRLSFIKNIEIQSYPISIGNNWYNESIHVNPSNSNHVVLSAISHNSSNGNSSQIFKTTDGGVNWNPIETNLPNTEVHDVIIDFTNSNVYYAATHTGIFGSEDEGEHWYPLAPDLGSTAVYMLKQKYIYGQECHVLYAATHGRGIWRGETNFTKTCERRELEFPITEIRDLFISPNPGNGYFYIKGKVYEVKQIDLFDLLGAKIFSQKYTEFLSEIKVNTQNLQRGLYEVVIYKVDGTREVHKWLKSY